MSEQQSNAIERHTWKKIWFGTVIFLCVVVILASAAGVVGTFVVGRAVSDATVRLLAGVERAAEAVEELARNFDQGVADIQDLTTQIGDATRQIGENVTDQGLLLTLLPEDRERRLMDRVQSLADSLIAIRKVVDSALATYQAIDSLPFISLPQPKVETLDRIEQAADDLRNGAMELVQAIRDFRAGVAGAIGKVTELTDRVDSRLNQSRENLDTLQAEMVQLQEQSANLQQTVPVAITIISLVITLFLAFVLYTQVEMIRLFAGRWKSLNAPVAALQEEAAGEVVSPMDETPASDVPPEATPPADAQG